MSHNHFPFWKDIQNLIILWTIFSSTNFKKKVWVGLVRWGHNVFLQEYRQYWDAGIKVIWRGGRATMSFRKIRIIKEVMGF